LLGRAEGQTAPSASSALRPVAASDAMIKAFDKYPIVALGDAHDCPEVYEFITSLVKNPDFPNKVNDIVVEFGNALYQDVIDRYVSGNDVSPAELNQVWRNTTQILVWDAPVYEQFFATIRGVNQSLPKQKQIRVLLGDPPIDWSKTQTYQQWGHWLFRRDEHFTSVVEKEVLSKGRRALLIIGGAHLMRAIDKGSITARIESQHPQSMFIVITHTGFTERNDELELQLKTWTVGSLAPLKGTWIGALHPRLRWPQLKNATLVDSKVEPKLEDVADAWLYVGPRDLLTESLAFPGIYRDEYWKELNRRNTLMWGKPLAPEDFNLRGRYYVPGR